MLWNESSLFNRSKMKLTVSSPEGQSILLEVSPDITVDKFKISVVSSLYETEEGAKVSLYHKLVRVGTGKTLAEENTLKQAGLGDDDELLLIKKRLPPPPIDTSQKEDRKTGSVESSAIMDATVELPKINFDRKLPETPSAENFHSELRKILISLIDAAQKLLCLNPHATKIFEDAEKLLGEHSSPNQHEVDSRLLQQLTDMGFPKVRATKALLLNRMSVSDAIQWLVDHDSDADIDEPLPGMSDDLATTSEETTDKTSDSQGAEAAESDALAGPQKVMRMLETFRSYRRKEFKPSLRALNNLVEMGFGEKESVEALRRHGNREEDACEWLLSNEANKLKVEDSDEGLDPESPVYKAIMSNPTVQLGLNNPRSLIAFLHMLENPSNTQQWLNDPDTGPMLIQVSRIYHAEKHAQQPSSSSSSSSSTSDSSSS